MSDAITGHWFCSQCNDIVNKPAPVGRWDSFQDAFCPVCRRSSAFWVKHIPTRSTVTPERAKFLFAKMRENFQPGDVI